MEHKYLGYVRLLITILELGIVFKTMKLVSKVERAGQGINNIMMDFKKQKVSKKE